MTEATKAKGQRELAFSQTDKSARTLTGANVPLVDGVVKQFMLVLPARVREIPSKAIVRNTETGTLLGYRALQGYGDWFPCWAAADGSVIAWCGEPLGVGIGRRLRLDLRPAVVALAWKEAMA